MTDEAKQPGDGADGAQTDDGAQEGSDKGPRQRMGEGIRSGIEVLSAFKETLEDSIREARERGDLSTDRAKELLREAVDRAQTAASGARERLDFVNHAELEALEGQVEALAARVAALEAKVDAGGASQAEEAPETNGD